MVDIYAQIQKTKKKPQEKDEADRMIEERQRQLEEENLNIARIARLKLQKTAQQQKEVTTELQKQGEQLVNAERSGKNVHKNVRRGAVTTEKIKDEGYFFKIPFIRQIKSFFLGYKTEDQLVTETRNNEDYDQSSSEFNIESFDKDEIVPGEDATDKELLGIYKTLKGMKNENKKQQLEIGKQKVTMENINTYNKDSEAIIDRTNKELKKL
ncbi:hypothetical protein DMUE_5078 [Dictyocoela muelleri]|nr:hypothetical protein DMUE_5078 [Dictyocoela muelleri]